MRKPIIVSITNHKGGVGKTTLAVMLGELMFEYFDKILLIDWDAQANLSRWLCRYTERVAAKITDLVKIGMTLDLNKAEQKNVSYLDVKTKEATYSIFKDNKECSIITSSLDLDRLKVQLSTDADFVRFKIRDLFRYISREYDLVIIDTPPSTELLTSTAIGASDYIIIPIQLEPNSVQGAVNIIEGVMPGVKTYLNPDVQLLGIVVNMYQSAETQNQIEAELKDYLEDKMFSNKISRSVRVGELSALGRAAPKLTRKSEKAVGELHALTEEIYNRIVKYEEDRG